MSDRAPNYLQYRGGKFNDSRTLIFSNTLPFDIAKKQPKRSGGVQEIIEASKPKYWVGPMAIATNEWNAMSPEERATPRIFDTGRDIGYDVIGVPIPKKVMDEMHYRNIANGIWWPWAHSENPTTTEPLEVIADHYYNGYLKFAAYMGAAMDKIEKGNVSLPVDYAAGAGEPAGAPTRRMLPPFSSQDNFWTHDYQCANVPGARYSWHIPWPSLEEQEKITLASYSKVGERLFDLTDGSDGRDLTQLRAIKAKEYQTLVAEMEKAGKGERGVNAQGMTTTSFRLPDKQGRMVTIVKTDVPLLKTQLFRDLVETMSNHPLMTFQRPVDQANYLMTLAMLDRGMAASSTGTALVPVKNRWMNMLDRLQGKNPVPQSTTTSPVTGETVTRPAPIVKREDPVTGEMRRFYAVATEGDGRTAVAKSFRGDNASGPLAVGKYFTDDFYSDDAATRSAAYRRIQAELVEQLPIGTSLSINSHGDHQVTLNVPVGQDPDHTYTVAAQHETRLTATKFYSAPPVAPADTTDKEAVKAFEKAQASYDLNRKNLFESITGEKDFYKGEEIDHTERYYAGFNLTGLNPDEFIDKAPTVADIVKPLRGRNWVLSGHRNDYTKGTMTKLEAWEQLLEKHPERAEDSTLIMVLQPTRAGVEGYKEYAESVFNKAREIRERFSKESVVIIPQGIAHEDLLGLMRQDEVKAFMSMGLKDGHDLTAREFVDANAIGNAPEGSKPAAKALICSVGNGASDVLGFNDAGEEKGALLAMQPDTRDKAGQVCNLLEYALDPANAEDLQNRMQVMEARSRKYGIAHFMSKCDTAYEQAMTDRYGPNWRSEARSGQHPQTDRVGTRHLPAKDAVDPNYDDLYVQPIQPRGEPFPKYAGQGR